MARTKMSKAANGEGSVYRRKSDGRWVASITLDNGSRKVFYGSRQSEVLEKLRSARAAKIAGRLRAVKGQTIGEYLDWWLDTRSQIEPATRDCYRQAIKWMKPHIGNRRTDKLTASQVEQCHHDLRGQGLSERSVQICHVVLRMAIKRAVKLGLASYNPTDDAERPRVGKTKGHTTLTLEQVHTLLDTSEGDPLHALYVIQVTGGLRIGEALALRWRDVDLDTGELRIERALQRQIGRGLVFKECKTAASRRTINLTKTAVQALRVHRTRQLEFRLQLGSLWHDHDLIFCTDVGKPLDAMNTYHRFQAALGKAGLPRIRQHDLRHTAATIAMMQNIHPKIVQEMLGHSNVNLTLSTYSHVLPTLQKDSAERMDEAFSKRKMASA